MSSNEADICRKFLTDLIEDTSKVKIIPKDHLVSIKNIELFYSLLNQLGINHLREHEGLECLMKINVKGIEELWRVNLNPNYCKRFLKKYGNEYKLITK